MGVDFKPYLIQILARVRKNWFAVIPESARMGNRGVVLLQFIIDRRGQVPKLVIATPSGAGILGSRRSGQHQRVRPVPAAAEGFQGQRSAVAIFVQVQREIEPRIRGTRGSISKRQSLTWPTRVGRPRADLTIRRGILKHEPPSLSLRGSVFFFLPMLWPRTDWVLTSPILNRLLTSIQHGLSGGLCEKAVQHPLA